MTVHLVNIPSPLLYPIKSTTKVTLAKLKEIMMLCVSFPISFIKNPQSKVIEVSLMRIFDISHSIEKIPYIVLLEIYT